MRFKSVCKTMCYCWIHNMRLQNNYTFCICLAQLSLFIIPHSLYSSQCLSTAVGHWKMWTCTPCFWTVCRSESASLYWYSIFYILFPNLHPGQIFQMVPLQHAQPWELTECFLIVFFLKLCKMRSLEAALVIRDAEAYFHPPFMSVQKRRFQWLHQIQILTPTENWTYSLIKCFRAKLSCCVGSISCYSALLRLLSVEFRFLSLSESAI